MGIHRTAEVGRIANVTLTKKKYLPVQTGRYLDVYKRQAYTFPKSQTRFADLKVFVQGTNLFSLDNIHFADPEQLGIAYPSTRSYWAGIKLNF